MKELYDVIIQISTDGWIQDLVWNADCKEIRPESWKDGKSRIKIKYDKLTLIIIIFLLELIRNRLISHILLKIPYKKASLHPNTMIFYLAGRNYSNKYIYLNI